MMVKIFTSTLLYMAFTFTYVQADFLDLFKTSPKRDINQFSKQLYIKYTKYPSTVYTNQRFSVELEARILTSKEDFDSVVTEYGNDEVSIDLLDGNITWKEQGDKYITKITYKAKDTNFELPTIRLWLEKDEEEVGSVKLDPPKIKFNKIAIDQDKFSNVIADDLKIKGIQAKQYNNKMLMIVCNIETVNGNLEEFNIKQFKDQGIKDFEEKYPVQSMYYYMIVPSHISSINFDYYNPVQREFITVELPIVLEEELVSTQTDLNPNDGSFLAYKQLISFVLLVVFIALYIRSKNKIFIVFIAIFLFMFIKLILPNKKVFIPSDTKVFILPTKSSTIYKVTNKKTKVEILEEKEGFLKVLFDNKNIGWIKDSDVK